MDKEQKRVNIPPWAGYKMYRCGDWTDDDLEKTAAELIGACVARKDAKFIAQILLDRGFRIVTYQQANAAKTRETVAIGCHDVIV